MHQQVVVTTDAPAALKPLLASAIQAELRMLELGLARIADAYRPSKSNIASHLKSSPTALQPEKSVRAWTTSNGLERSRPTVVLRGNGKP